MGKILRSNRFDLDQYLILNLAFFYFHNRAFQNLSPPVNILCFFFQCAKYSPNSKGSKNNGNLIIV